RRTLVALVGVQSHQFQRALDLAAFARSRGVEGCVIGGPHAMTCDTTAHQGRGVSFALSEAERIWPAILADAASGELEPSYGGDGRWERELDPPALVPPPLSELRRYIVRLLGVYPARGCPYTCNFCSVIKIAGRSVRSQPLETTLASLRAAERAGVEYILFTSDNFNKIPEAGELLEAMIAERLRLPFFVQCDTQIERQEELVELLAKAGCFQIFVGAESFDAATLKAAHKFQNRPERYARIVALCRRYGVTSHFSNILGFPTDTEAGIRRHLDTLRALGPDVASFYILTPIPGTEQYAEFLDQGLIEERNLDRFDGACVTWRHPELAPERWVDALYSSYREFFAVGDVMRKLARIALRRPDFRTKAALLSVAGYSAQSRLGAIQRAHPMAGGVARVHRDHADDYRTLRRQTFDCDLAPLPANLDLTAADEAINKHAKLRVIA
ncbi:MAG: B12-binding domain-containing radical SAM protein, partial [Myxococcota bacterium]